MHIHISVSAHKYTCDASHIPNCKLQTHVLHTHTRWESRKDWMHWITATKYRESTAARRSWASKARIMIDTKYYLNLRNVHPGTEMITMHESWITHDFSIFTRVVRPANLLHRQIFLWLYRYFRYNEIRKNHHQFIYWRRNYRCIASFGNIIIRIGLKLMGACEIETKTRNQMEWS